ncbi:MAG TPA: hypothetical protein VFH51_07625 [Myxococcota bacterium]|nr:hypothetical protein [Myxococcota bacterium]
MLKDTVKGAVIASAVASMFGAVALQPQAARAADEGKVKCEAGNACNGKSACHTAKNSCAGQNKCKGQGWVWAKDAAECKKLGGKVTK